MASRAPSTVGTSPSQARNAKKLATFFRDKEKSSNRFKSVLSFVESTDLGEDEEKKFFSDNYESIFTVLYDRFLTASENVAKRGHRKTHKDLLSVLLILKKIITYLSNVINTRWQIEKIGTIIQKCLWRGNVQQIRLAAFDLLIYFIEALQNSMESQQIELFATAINLVPFIPADSKMVIKHNKPGDPVVSLLPSPDPASKKDSIEMLDYFLDFISNKSNNFLFWFNLFKEKYLMTFYPKIFQELRLLDKYDETGFKPHCPHEIQQVLIDRLASWGEKVNIFTIIWDSNSNAPIMLEINRQSCTLPLTYAATITKSMQIFRSWLMNFQKNKLFAEHLQDYWQQFIKNLALIFTIESSVEEIDSHHTMCKEILYIYNYFAVELSAKLAKETWEVLQYTMLISTFDLLNKTSPNSSSHSHTTFNLLNKTSPNPQKGTKNDTLADHLFGSLYFFWIRSQITTTEMWKDISKKVASLTNWKANLLQWKEKIIQLTYIMRDMCYVTDPKSRDHSGTAATDGEKTAEDKFMKASRVPRASLDSMNFARDPRLGTVTWTPESIQEVWSTMLHILGNITKISDPISHEIALSCVYEVVRVLVNAEEKLPLNTPAPIPVMKIFLPWLIEASVYDDRLIKGLLLAYRTLCVLFCRRQTISANSELNYLLAHFYRIIQMGLNNVKSEVIWEIIEDSLSIFSYDLPGVAVLIPDFLREIEVLCGPQTTVSPSVKQNALVIVNSLICYPNHFNGLEFPVVAQPKPYETKKENNLTAEDIREKISSILLAVLTNLNEHSSNTLLALCGGTVLLFEELHHPSVRANIVSKFVTAILECTDHVDDAISQTAAECLSSLTALYDKFCTLDKSLVVNIVTVLCDKVITLITQSGSKRENAVANLMFCLKDWLLAESNDLLSNKDIVSKVFQTIEYGLLGELVVPQIKSPKPPKEIAAAEKGPNPPTLKRDKPAKKGQNSANKIGAESYESLFDELKNSPIHGSFLIREAAEITLLQLLNQYNNFPSAGGAEVTGTQINDYDDSNAIHFVYNDLMVISLSEVQSANGKVARLLIRDSTGKYAWDSNLIYDDKETSNANTTANTNALAVTLPPPKADVAAAPAPAHTRKKGELLKFSENVNLSGTDMLGEVLSYLSETNSDFTPLADMMSNPNIVDAPTLETIKEKIKQLEEQHKQEEAFLTQLKNDEKAAKLSVLTKDSKLTPPMKFGNISASTFHLCRLFLSHLGFLGKEARKRLTLLGSEDSQRFMRSLKELDLLPGRELFKVGLIYVAPGQEDQRDILKNSGGSDLYSEFLRGIGWLVDLKTHPGFTGGLDRNLSTGKTAPYFATPSYEVMFHVPTLMPSNPQDEQQIDKKRHVGNDYTHIVWSEHKRDYKPTTISSNFNEAHIVVYPLPNGLFRVQIFRKERIAFFGPLLDGMIVNKKILCSLARQTSINASRRARSLTKGYQRPFPTRNAFIKEIIQRFKTEKSFEEFLTAIYPVKLEAEQLGNRGSTWMAVK